MIAPGLLVILSPLLIGFLFGAKGVSGLLAGSIVSGVQIAISFSNSGGAWDNAKKYIEAGHLRVDGVRQEKKSDAHMASVVGDTVGDPLKDTSGPSINILIKLMAITSLVFSGAFQKYGGITLKHLEGMKFRI
jgi:H+-translocating diphosphatase